MEAIDQSGQLVNDEVAAGVLDMSPSTLRSWRCRGVGPVYIKLGHGKRAAVRYDLRDLARFIEQGRQDSSSSVRAAFEE
jgi:hypothetical protein